MKIADLFETRVEEKIEPVIKVGERGDEHKLASEIGSYVVTPMIEGFLDDMLEHYTDTFLNKTTEIGIWISGYFGSGKSHFAKILSLLAGNPVLEGVPASKRFESRVPHDAPRRTSILRSLSRVGNCETNVLAFNLNSLADSRSRPLPGLLLSQYYLAVRPCRQSDLCSCHRSGVGQAGQAFSIARRRREASKKAVVRHPEKPLVLPDTPLQRSMRSRSRGLCQSTRRGSITQRSRTW